MILTCKYCEKTMLHIKTILHVKNKNGFLCLEKNLFEIFFGFFDNFVVKLPIFRKKIIKNVI